jgi:psp operon transcriptional activator
VAGLSAPAAEVLVGYRWPGNVRELRNVVERAVYRWDDPERPVAEILFDPFASPWQPQGQEACSIPVAEPAPAPSSPALPEPAAVTDLRAATDAFEKAAIEAALSRKPLQPARNRQGAGAEL